MGEVVAPPRQRRRPVHALFDADLPPSAAHQRPPEVVDDLDAVEGRASLVVQLHHLGHRTVGDRVALGAWRFIPLHHLRVCQGTWRTCRSVSFYISFPSLPFPSYLCVTVAWFTRRHAWRTRHNISGFW